MNLGSQSLEVISSSINNPYPIKTKKAGWKSNPLLYCENKLHIQFLTKTLTDFEY